MILVGRTLSPFVRRVAVWAAVYGIALKSRPLAATDPKDAEAIREIHPGMRVPALILDDGTVLIESGAICDWLDEGAPEGARLVPASGMPRRACLQRIAMAMATAEKGAALVYEKNRRPEEHQWPAWQERLTGQIRGGLGAVEAALPEAGWQGGAAPDGSDIAAAIVYQFVEATNPWLLEPGYPRLAALAERAADIPGFAATDPR